MHRQFVPFKICPQLYHDRTSAINLISEICTDMKQFTSSKRLCCWAGLTPGNNESAGKKKSVRITRAGVYLKPALVQCAHAAVKSTTNPYYKNKYERILLVIMDSFMTSASKKNVHVVKDMDLFL